MRITVSLSGDFATEELTGLMGALCDAHGDEVVISKDILPAKGSRLVTCTVEDPPAPGPGLSLSRGLFTDVAMTVIGSIRNGDVLVRQHPVRDLGPALRIYYEATG